MNKTLETESHMDVTNACESGSRGGSVVGYKAQTYT